jgi:hypothetical protein
MFKRFFDKFDSIIKQMDDLKVTKIARVEPGKLVKIRGRIFALDPKTIVTARQELHRKRAEEEDLRNRGGGKARRRKPVEIPDDVELTAPEFKLDTEYVCTQGDDGFVDSPFSPCCVQDDTGYTFVSIPDSNFYYYTLFPGTAPKLDVRQHLNRGRGKDLSRGSFGGSSPDFPEVSSGATGVRAKVKEFTKKYKIIIDGTRIEYHVNTGVLRYNAPTTAAHNCIVEKRHRQVIRTDDVVCVAGVATQTCDVLTEQHFPIKEKLCIHPYQDSYLRIEKC